MFSDYSHSRSSTKMSPTALNVTDSLTYISRSEHPPEPRTFRYSCLLGIPIWIFNHLHLMMAILLYQTCSSPSVLIAGNCIINLSLKILFWTYVSLSFLLFIFLSLKFKQQILLAPPSKCILHLTNFHSLPHYNPGLNCFYPWLV